METCTKTYKWHHVLEPNLDGTMYWNPGYIWNHELEPNLNGTMHVLEIDTYETMY